MNKGRSDKKVECIGNKIVEREREHKNNTSYHFKKSYGHKLLTLFGF